LLPINSNKYAYRDYHDICGQWDTKFSAHFELDAVGARSAMCIEIHAAKRGAKPSIKTSKNPKDRARDSRILERITALESHRRRPETYPADW